MSVIYWQGASGLVAFGRQGAHVNALRVIDGSVEIHQRTNVHIKSKQVKQHDLESAPNEFENEFDIDREPCKGILFLTLAHPSLAGKTHPTESVTVLKVMRGQISCEQVVWVGAIQDRASMLENLALRT